MDDINNTGNNEPLPGEGTPGSNEPETTPPAPSQPDKPEQKFTKRERLLHAFGKIKEQLDELGNDDADDDSRPLTVGEFKRMTQEKSKQTALELALSIENVDERTEVENLLKSRIIPTDKPEEDLKLARQMVNARKAAQLAEEALRAGKPGAHASTPGAPGQTPGTFIPTDEELIFMRPPYNLTKEEILAQRNRQPAE